MWSVRNVKTHKVVASGFASQAEAASKAQEFIDRDWNLYEAYPSHLGN